MYYVQDCPWEEYHFGVLFRGEIRRKNQQQGQGGLKRGQSSPRTPFWLSTWDRESRKFGEVVNFSATKLTHTVALMSVRRIESVANLSVIQNLHWDKFTFNVRDVIHFVSSLSLIAVQVRGQLTVWENWWELQLLLLCLLLFWNHLEAALPPSTLQAPAMKPHSVFASCCCEAIFNVCHSQIHLPRSGYKSHFGLFYSFQHFFVV